MLLLINLILLISALNVESVRILGVFMTPSYSHQVVYQPIWKELSLRGHQVTIITPNPLKDQKLINLTEIDVSSSYSIFRETNEAGIFQEKSVFSEMKRFSKLYEKLAKYQLNLPEVQKLIKDKNQKFDLLLVEYLYPSMYALKDLYDCPMIGITSLGLTSLGNEFIGNPKNPAFDPDLSLTTSINQSFKERFISTIYDIFTRLSGKYILMKKWDQILPEYLGTKDIRPLYEISKDFSLIIVNSNLAIRNPKPNVPNLVEISGIHVKKPKPLPKDLKQHLDNSTEGVIYFSLGSNMKSALIPKEKLNDLMEVFSELPYKILWKFEKEELDNKPKNVEIRKWLPQQDVLAHPNIKLFITQGGIQSIDEALFRKVPMLIMPFFGDQFYNAHNLVNKGGALSIDYQKMSKNDLKNTILELMNNPKYQNHINELSEIATDQMVPALDKAVWWIEYVIRHDGARHLQYKERDVPFYQFYLLDIIAAVVSSIFISIYLTIVSIKTTIRFAKISKSYLQTKIKTKSD